MSGSISVRQGDYNAEMLSETARREEKSEEAIFVERIRQVLVHRSVLKVSWLSPVAFSSCMDIISQRATYEDIGVQRKLMTAKIILKG